MDRAPKQAIVGFLTDFGLSDPYVGQVKAVMLSLNPSMKIVDLGHMIEPFCIECASYSVYSSYKYIPKGGGILAVVDPGVGSNRRALIATAHNRVFVGPDNGLLWQVLKEDENARVYEIDEDKVRPPWGVSATFHGRDLFGPAMAISLLKGVESVAKRPLEKASLVKLDIRVIRGDGETLCLKAVYVDRFGNVALSATLEDVELPSEGGRLVVVGKSGEWEARVLPSFSLAGPGEMVSYFNSFGFLELAVNQGSAATSLDLKVGDWICVRGLRARGFQG